MGEVTTSKTEMYYLCIKLKSTDLRPFMFKTYNGPVKGHIKHTIMKWPGFFRIKSKWPAFFQN